MKRVLILHGWGGSDAPHWQAWLASEIAQNYGTVAFPLLDNPHFPSKNRWVKQFRSLLETFKPAIVVCHSLACNTWLHLCDQGNIVPVEHLLLVAPPRLDLELDTIKTFFPTPVPKNLYAKNAAMVASDNDPYMPLETAQALALRLGVALEVIENGGHINSDSGFGPWPWVKAWVENARERG